LDLICLDKEKMSVQKLKIIMLNQVNWPVQFKYIKEKKHNNIFESNTKTKAKRIVVKRVKKMK